MANTPDFIAHLLELMRPAGRASARAMFGGHGLYLDGLIVAIVVEDVLYLKTDDETRSAYVQRELDPFCYTTRDGKAYQAVLTPISFPGWSLVTVVPESEFLVPCTPLASSLGLVCG